MNFKHGNTEEEVSINLTPLIDVVFLLLIFFMVSTTFDTTSQLEIQLPEASENKA
ncbi:MAG: biopolymer transporter ExbD, partial [Gammaproteobacteria bacterium]